MLNIIIVDDEVEIASGIAFLIKRYNSDICQVVGTATNGREGCHMALELHPDVILTDIKMPECDGLEMISLLKEKNLGAEFVVLSGYVEFEYAKRAMQLGVTNFLTKPVDEEELRETLTKLSRTVNDKKRVEDAYESMQWDVVELSLRDYLKRGKSVDIGKVKKNLSAIGFPTNAERYVCSLIKCTETKEPDRSILLHARVIIADECRKTALMQDSIVVECSADSMAIITGTVMHTRIEDFIHALENVKRRLRAQESLLVSIGIGYFVFSIEEIAESYETAELALNYRILKGPNSVIAYKYIENIESHPAFISSQDMKALEECIDRLDEKGCEREVRKIFEQIRGQDELSLASLQQISLNLVLFGIRKISAAQLQMNQYLGKNIFTLESIEKFSSIDQLENWIINTLKGMSQLMLKDNQSEKKDIVEEAKAYIRKNFDKNISLNDISEKFYINPYYFSQLFKKKTGVKYQDYVIELRVDRAKKLLRETELKIYEICTIVGYSDMNHFNHVFERITGVKPGEYRKKGD